MADIFDRLAKEQEREEDLFDRLARESAPPRSAISEATRGLATGITQAGTTSLEALGTLTGSERLERFGRRATEQAEEYFDPRGTAGKIGQTIGRVGGEIGTSLIGGGAVLKGAKAIPKVATALRGMTATQRALAAGAAGIPVDVLQGAKEEEGILLPGRAGSIIENVALGQTGSLLAARRAGVPAETRPSRLLPAKTGIEGAQAYEGPIGPAIPMRGAVEPEEVTKRITAAAEQAGIEVPKPLIEVIESSARGGQPFRYDPRQKSFRLYGTNRAQAQYLKSIEETAGKLDKEAARLRAFQEPDMEAVTQLEAMAEAGRRMRDVLSPGGLIARPGVISGELLAQGGGALTGAAAGAATADAEDRADVIGRAALGAATGFGLGRSAVRGFPGPTKLADALRRGGDYGQTVIEGRLRKAPSVGKPKLFEPTISEGTAKILDEQATAAELELAAAGVFRESKTLKGMVREGERFLDSLQPGARTIMTDEEFAARAARIGNRSDALNQVAAKLEDANLSFGDREFLQDAHKRIFDAIVSDTQKVQPALSSAGLRMNVARQMGAKDIRSAITTAKSLADIPPGADLSDAAKEQIRAVFAKPEAQRPDALREVYQSLIKRGRWERITNFRIVGLLSTPATWAVNFLGSSAEAAQNAIAHPFAVGMDAAYAGLTGKRRTMVGGTRAKDWLDAWVASGKRIISKESIRKIVDGIPVDNVYGGLERLKGSYVTDFNLQPQEAESAFRQTARAGARALDIASNAVYGIMEAADVPFYRAALATSLKERAAVRALNEGLGNNPQAFAKRVQELLTPEGINVVDNMLATADALDATYKTRAGVGQALRALGPVGEVLRFEVPFANTPTNIVRKALEGVPILGSLVTKAQNKAVAQKMRRLGATVEDVNDEMRRRYIDNLARQATTGLGGMAAGFFLHQAGYLTPGYTPSRGATPEEKEGIQRRALTGEAPLAIRIGDESYSLGYLGTLAPALAIGAAMSQAAKDDVEKGFGTVAVPAAKATYRTFLDMPLLKGVSNIAEMASGGTGPLDVELGKRVASFVPSAVAAVARGMDVTPRREAETFGQAIKERIPGMREELAIKPGPFGEVQPGVGVLRSLFDPTRPQKIRTGGIYDELERLEVYPGQRGRRPGESAQAYYERRAIEGETERKVLEDILSGQSAGLRNVSASARRAFREVQREQGDVAATRLLIDAALKQTRAKATEADKQAAERMARLEGLRPRTQAFKDRVEQIKAGNF